MSDPKSTVPPYEDLATAPVVYFDVVGANGIMNGAVQIELAQRILVPVAGSNDVTIKFATSGRLRCSPTAAKLLIDSLGAALEMLDKAQQQPTAAGSKLN